MVYFPNHDILTYNELLLTYLTINGEILVIWNEIYQQSTLLIIFTIGKPNCMLKLSKGDGKEPYQEMIIKVVISIGNLSRIMVWWGIVKYFMIDLLPSHSGRGFGNPLKGKPR